VLSLLALTAGGSSSDTPTESHAARGTTPANLERRVLIFTGVYIEKGMGLVIPGMTPDTLGEIYEYFPTANELAVSAGIFAAGSLAFTLMVKVAKRIMVGRADK
jgi:Ni/Fe-hydrogenase subunit HybB-like protein